MTTMSPSEAAALPAHVLLVEDEPIIAMTAEMMLADLGIEHVQVAHSVAEALRLVDDTRFDCAILDHFLGSETSIPVAERLCAQGIAIVIASGMTDIELPESCQGARFLRKPYRIQDLQRVLAS